VREVSEKKKKKKKKKERKKKKKNVSVFCSHFSLCVFIWNDKVSACDWRAEKPSFLHQPDSSCSPLGLQLATCNYFLSLEGLHGTSYQLFYKLQVSHI
jgi:hypothetical protein